MSGEQLEMQPYGHERRFHRLAEALMATPDPVTAIAHELGDQHARIDVLVADVKALSFKVSQLRSMQGGER